MVPYRCLLLLLFLLLLIVLLLVLILFLPGRIVVLKLVQIRLRFDQGIIHKRVISSISGSDAYNVFDRNF